MAAGDRIKTSGIDSDLHWLNPFDTG
jgi:hypothetical protein